MNAMAVAFGIFHVLKVPLAAAREHTRAVTELSHALRLVGDAIAHGREPRTTQAESLRSALLVFLCAVVSSFCGAPETPHNIMGGECAALPCQAGDSQAFPAAEHSGSCNCVRHVCVAASSMAPPTPEAGCAPNVDGLPDLQHAYRCFFLEPLMHVASIVAGLLAQAPRPGCSSEFGRARRAGVERPGCVGGGGTNVPKKIQ